MNKILTNFGASQTFPYQKKLKRIDVPFSEITVIIRLPVHDAFTVDFQERIQAIQG